MTTPPIERFLALSPRVAVRRRSLHPGAGHAAVATGSAAQRAPADPRRFHAQLPGYRPTPLVELPAVARALGLGRVVVKNEQERLGLPAYKVLGGSWALHEAIRERLGRPAGDLLAPRELRAGCARIGGVALCTATDGNHGRGIAAMAELLGVPCTVLVPADTVAERIAAIEGHGARVVVVPGSYHDAVEAAAQLAARAGLWLCADTATGTDAPAAAGFARDVQRGYATLFAELVEQLGRAPDALVIQAGVGALAASAAAYFEGAPAPPRLVIAEPIASPCVHHALVAGAPTAVPDHFTIMAGLRAQEVSRAAWPLLAARAAAAVLIDDDDAAAAVRELAAAGVIAGESGAAGLAGLAASAAGAARAALGLGPGTWAAVINTEGATDRARYAAIVGAAADARGAPGQGQA